MIRFQINLFNYSMLEEYESKHQLFFFSLLLFHIYVTSKIRIRKICIKSFLHFMKQVIEDFLHCWHCSSMFASLIRIALNVHTVNIFNN